MRFAPWMAVLLVVLATAAVRWRVLETPLERDEGEYAYMGQLMLQGIPPYQLAANMKLPGTYAAYAAMMAVFGQTIGGIHIGLMLVNAAAIVLIAILGMRLFGTSAGIAASAAYALMSVGSQVMGTQAHATHFVVLAALAGALLLLRFSDSGRLSALAGSGILFGLAFLMKQPGILFILFALCWLVATEWPRRRSLPVKALVFGTAAAVPFLLTCLVMWRAGVFQKFWFWTFTYAREYASEVSLADGWDDFTDTVVPLVQENAALWVLAAAGLVYIWFRRESRRSAIFLTALLVFSFLAVCPGLYFRGHYFVMLLPAVALLAGALVKTRPAALAFTAALLLSIFTQRDFLFRLTPVQISRELYGRSPFPEAIPIANYIRSHTSKDARIAVLGSEPEIYFYADRHSATSHIYMYGLMEAQPYAVTMQEDLIREVTAAAPEYIVEASILTSWQREEDSPTRIFDWWTAYRTGHYQLVGLAEILSRERTEYRWDAAAEGYRPRGDRYILVYRRKP